MTTLESKDLATVLVSAIGGAVSVYLATLPILLGTRRDARKAAAASAGALEQVANNHSTNLREEGDERHAQQVAILDEVKRLLRANAQRQGRASRRLEQKLDGVSTRVGVLELERSQIRRGVAL